MLTLIIGNRNYSSWSLRAWLYLFEAGVTFDTRRVPLFEPGSAQALAQLSPTGRVPALIDGDIHIADSWAIIEHVRQTREVRIGWPEDVAARARALSVSAEMHAGFLDVRAELPMNLRAPTMERWSALGERTRKEVDRIRTIWTECLDRYGGPFLFGALSIPDIMYAPVVTRFRTYQIALDDRHRAYSEAIFDLAGMQTWIAAARDETESLDFIDSLARDTPLHPG